MGGPQELADEARDEAMAAIQDAADVEDDVKRHRAEQVAIREFADTIADALSTGLYKSEIGSYASVLAKASYHYNKSQIQQRIHEVVEEQHYENRTTLNEYVKESLKEVVVVSTTDHKQGSTYQWHFEECKVETRSGKDGRGHFNWNHYRDSILEAGGPNVAPPGANYSDGSAWRRFMVDIIEDYGREVTTEGPRTVAVRKLQNRIEASIGYSDLGDAAERDDIYLEIPTADLPEWWAKGQPFRYERPAPIDDLPEWWTEFANPPGRKSERYPPEWYGNTRFERPAELPVPETVTEIRVPNHLVTNLCEAEGISARALQVELDARGYTLERLNGGVSETTTVRGQRFAYWALSPDLAVPDIYQAEPKSPADRIRVERSNEPKQAAADGGGDGFESVGGSG